MFSSLFKRFSNSSSPRNEAKKRLQVSLVYDKLEVNNVTLGKLQKDIVDVISRYFEIDKDALELDVKTEGNVSALVLNTPILQVTHKKN